MIGSLVGRAAGPAGNLRYMMEQEFKTLQDKGVRIAGQVVEVLYGGMEEAGG